MNILKVWEGLKPVVMMVMVQLSLTVVNILYKLAGLNGLSLPVLIAYRFLFAAAAIIPLALILERKKRPKLTGKILLQAFGTALFGGSLAQNLYAEGLVLTSATFAAAIANLIPGCTFILVIIFRMEQLGLKTMAGKAKLTGTILCIAGAMILTFYKGSVIDILTTSIDLIHKSQTSGHVAVAHHSSRDNVLGLLVSLASCVSVSLALIIQAKIVATYPCHYSSTALTSIMGSIQAVVFALCVERDWNQWKLGWDLKLLTVIYPGVIASGLMWVLTMACVRMKGPLFVSSFNPLLLVFVAIAGSLFLNEKLHVGSVIGALVIICGLYLVLWGKSKTVKKINPTTVEETTVESVQHPSIVVASNVVVPECEVVDIPDEEDLDPKIKI